MVALLSPLAQQRALAQEIEDLKADRLGSEAGLRLWFSALKPFEE